MTLPSGTVTFLFTDIEGSTHLLQEPGARRIRTDRGSIARDARRSGVKRIMDRWSRHDNGAGDLICVELIVSSF